MNIRIITFTRVGRINYSLIGGIYCVYHYIFVAMVMCAPRDRLPCNGCNHSVCIRSKQLRAPRTTPGIMPRSDSFQWTDDEVKLLLHVTQEYKVSKLLKVPIGSQLKANTKT